MHETFRPETTQEVAAVVRDALARARPLEVAGGGSKCAWGRPVEAPARLDLSRLAGVSLYEPEELVLTAQAATPLVEIERVLEERGQHLAFEPPDLGPLLDGDPGAPNARRGTLGGAVACNLAGPRRVKMGSARDHILGFHGVSGRGEPFKAGGRVVKNVTGFDLAKLIAGSFGTLAVITELTLRALPAPEASRTLVVAGLDDAAAVRAMTAALGGVHDVSGAAHLPEDVAAASAVGPVAGAGAAMTLLRLEGPAPSVASRAGGLVALLAAFGPISTIEGDDSRALWREVRDARFLVADRAAQVWRLSVPPASGAEIAARIQSRVSGRVFYDWGGGLIWLAIAARDDAGEALVRAAIGPGGGHAGLLRADAAVRLRVPPFQPQPGPLAALSARVKRAFDPERILEPGRMYRDH